MKKTSTLFTFVMMIIALISINKVSFSQTLLQEGFETTDTIPGAVPPGWAIYNGNTYPVDPTADWTVKTAGAPIVLISSPMVVHSGNRGIAISWYVATDTVSGALGLTNSWLVTPGVNVVLGDSLRFFATGGSPNHPWYDSLQIWASSIDSTPEFFELLPTNKLATIVFPIPGATQFEFRRYAYGLNSYIGQKTWIAFRYYTNNGANDGYGVILDDIKIGTVVGVNTISTNVPEKFNLSQNYPNPFNPTTKIKFDIAKASNVKITVYSSLGQEVAVLANGFLNAGFYETQLDAKSLSSGTYFYRIEAGEFIQTKKLTVVK
ncbi:hypothetical protein BH10BAC5_BH10BAC5_01450 [soil metagenome]